jgi:hypothetical protein
MSESRKSQQSNDPHNLCHTYVLSVLFEIYYYIFNLQILKNGKNKPTQHKNNSSTIIYKLRDIMYYRLFNNVINVLMFYYLAFFGCILCILSDSFKERSVFLTKQPTSYFPVLRFICL